MSELMEKQMVSTYHGKPELKTAFVAETIAHEQADAFLKGTYGDFDPTFKGCAIGCAVHSLHRIQKTDEDLEEVEYADHEKVAADLGIPLWLAYMEDHLFENLPDELSKTWPRRLAEAIPVGAVIDDTVLAKFIVWSLTAERFGVIHATDDAQIKGRITAIADAITAEAEGRLTDELRAAAEGAARAAWAARATWAAWDARATWAARDARAARAARDAWAARAAGAAWDARATWAARDAWAARAARDAWAARAAGAARDAWAARAKKTHDEFYPALSEFVLKTLSELPVKS